MTKIDEAARADLEEAISRLEALGWKVTAYDVDGDPGVMKVNLSMLKMAGDDMQVQQASGGYDRD